MDCFITDYKIDPPAGAERAVLEDSIMHKGRPVTAGSKILENFISPIDAQVVARLEAAGVTILGKTKMDEFGAAGLFADAQKQPSGAVSLVASGIAAFALCNDYTGTVRQQSASQGICYIHPTYGTVSRYGLIPAVSSMDQIGIACKTPDAGMRALTVIAGSDPKDGAMFSEEQEKKENRQGIGELVIGIPENVMAKTRYKSAALDFVKDFNTVGFELKHFDIFAQIMQILCCAELSNNISRYDGIKYGYRTDKYSDMQELYTGSRTEALGPDVKLASMIGAMVLSQDNYMRYYDKAMRLRRLIKESLEFDKYDAIIMPASGEAPDSILAMNALPQLCGLPSVTVPLEDSGVSLIADAKCENVLNSVLDKAKAVEP